MANWRKQNNKTCTNVAFPEAEQSGIFDFFERQNRRYTIINLIFDKQNAVSVGRFVEKENRSSLLLFRYSGCPKNWNIEYQNIPISQKYSDIPIFRNCGIPEYHTIGISEHSNIQIFRTSWIPEYSGVLKFQSLEYRNMTWLDSLNIPIFRNLEHISGFRNIGTSDLSIFLYYKNRNIGISDSGLRNIRIFRYSGIGISHHWGYWHIRISSIPSLRYPGLMEYQNTHSNIPEYWNIEISEYDVIWQSEYSYIPIFRNSWMLEYRNIGILEYHDNPIFKKYRRT